MKKNINLINNQIQKILNNNSYVIILFVDKETLLENLSLDDYKSNIKNVCADLLGEEVKLYKIFNINSDKYKNEINSFLFGIDNFPLMLVFENKHLKFISPILF
jgi:hypothetical protein